MASYATGILFVTGVLTAGVLAGAFAPRLVLALLLGVDDPSPAVVVLARHWALLIGLVGLLLMYASVNPEARLPALALGSIEKIALVGSVFLTPLRRRPVATLAASADAVMAALYVALLLAGVGLSR
jgi:hypothetical protein